MVLTGAGVNSDHSRDEIQLVTTWIQKTLPLSRPPERLLIPFTMDEHLGGFLFEGIINSAAGKKTNILFRVDVDEMCGFLSMQLLSL